MLEATHKGIRCHGLSEGKKNNMEKPPESAFLEPVLLRTKEIIR